MTLTISQILFSLKMRDLLDDPRQELIAPSKEQAIILSLGDKQFFFRKQCARMQRSGDAFGRLTAVGDYNYENIYNWLKILSWLDPLSSTPPSLGAYYYGGITNKEKIKMIVDYLEDYASEDIYSRWIWIAHAAHMANFKLKDPERAMTIAKKVQNIEAFDDMPHWLRFLPAIIANSNNETDSAINIIDAISSSVSLTKTERRYITTFTKKVLKDAESLSEKHEKLID